ncbi:hypothetical protein L915_12761 [Phytophthora nicotianae]|uniref:Uncharacterized protein n=1 Tax=Phytophthora nicotianae TaxID=4792 RepID=W2GHJ4_PHYNI|nr:hypothetical protein L915_12761 [Phytophthora nicotianae]ETM41656.1 hypothetical protein L914_12589 [Phytophthora nicotianae]
MRINRTPSCRSILAAIPPPRIKRIKKIGFTTPGGQLKLASVKDVTGHHPNPPVTL